MLRPGGAAREAVDCQVTVQCQAGGDAGIADLLRSAEDDGNLHDTVVKATNRAPS